MSDLDVQRLSPEGARTSEAATPAARARPGAATPGFRRDIEGLRGLAILLVVAYHAGIPGFAGGYVGVDVFFVLSGYLITGLLIAEIEKTGRVDFPGFYARRARRLLPAAFTVIVGTLLAGRVLYAPIEHRDLANAGLVDEVEVAIIPVLLGDGLPLLAGPASRLTLALRAQRTYKSSGIVVLTYDVT